VRQLYQSLSQTFYKKKQGHESFVHRSHWWVLANVELRQPIQFFIVTREKIITGDIKSEFVDSNNQLADIFTKPLRGPRIDYICNKLGTYDLYAPA